MAANARAAALDVLLHNASGPYSGLPRTAGWGYPEPYTRDLMIAALGVFVTGNERLIDIWRRILEMLAQNQSRLGHIPSLVHDACDRGASDTTPLFLLITAIYRKISGEADFLEEAVSKALTWMEYQSPDDCIAVTQMPTSDWRDEQWVLGYGLFVNTVVYCYLQLYGQHRRAAKLRKMMSRFTVTGDVRHRHVHEGLALRRKPYYALWAYKVYSSERFDLLGNSLAVLAGIDPPLRAEAVMAWIENECEALHEAGELAVDLPPNLFPYIKPGDPDWIGRYEKYNMPGRYHNGGVWPFICGFYVAAAVAAGQPQLAQHKFEALTALVWVARAAPVDYGFNEWFCAQDGQPCGQDWQTWSAAMYLYAAECVERGKTPFFDWIREAGGIRLEECPDEDPCV